MKKIIYIADGNSIHTKKWISFFSKEFNCILISDTKLKEENKKFWKEKNVKIYDFNVSTKSKLLKILNTFRKSILYNYVIFKNRKNSILHWHFIGLNVIFSLPFAFLIKKRIATFWGSDFNLAKRIQKYIIKITGKISNFITSDTEEILEKLNKNYKIDKIKLIYINHGIDLRIFNCDYSITKNNNFIIFSPRALTPFYNHHLLFNNIDILIDKFGNNIKLIFIDYNTDNKYKQKLLKIKNKYPYNIELLSPLSQKELAKQYNISNIVVSIPQDDGLPVTLIESIFCEKPIIGINKNDYKNILPEKYLIKDYNIDEIIDKISYIINNKNIISNEIKNIKNQLINKFDYKANMEEMKKIYLK